ncbi:hypothetical protein AMJ44_04445 [candidate division WOR-1 bacterium DG_54_3]|uniref:Uncharacterized protein n=1 Tax=candidate division WOR-1 bacterium DG_54_3 TaxID=1703775 RepID=A0A0S7Y3L2_UNCSA|nr:MAG: hypothetical protein AMJ44_04445 [candidate division WOR-1 bacterium DG_54_3]
MAIDTTNMKTGGLETLQSESSNASNSSYVDINQLNDTLKGIATNAIIKFEKSKDASKSTEDKQLVVNQLSDFGVKGLKVNTFV